MNSKLRAVLVHGLVAGLMLASASPVPTKNSVRVDFLDFSGRGQVAFRR